MAAPEKTVPKTIALVQAIHAVLPQTQCKRCGYADCHAYAQAIADGEAHINQCPPGGAEGMARLAQVTGLSALGMVLNPTHGREGPRHLVRIDEAACIGCTLCIQACPVDCIVGAPKHMHVVMTDHCTGCELCLPACPVDCMHLEDATPGQTGWNAWSAEQAGEAFERYEWHQTRTARDAREQAQRLSAHSPTAVNPQIEPAAS
jgi:Na+-translocating ferredoxin:NAD+ oxidoreductase subunit B